MASFVRWLWYFGDGSTSTEKNPKHTYAAPGIYTVSLETEDNLGNVYTFTKYAYIYVYDYLFGGDGLRSGSTNFCFKHAVKSSQGQGICPYAGRWVWPAILCCTVKGYNSKHENLSLIVNSEDMKIYRIGIPELWEDRSGSYDEAEIVCDAFLPEIVSRNGEHENVRHVETHVPMRSWDEKNYRGKSGYTADGFKDAHQLSIEVYESGEQIVPKTKLIQVNRGGDFAFLKEVEAKRFQLKLIYSTSAFRTPKVICHAQEIDHRTPPQLNDIPEKRYQKEYNQPDIWFSRNKPSIYTNRADGVVWTGTAVSTTGPDSKRSGFISAAGLAGVTAYVTGDFTIQGFIEGDGTIYQAQVQGGGVVTISFIGGVLTFDDGIDAVVWVSGATGWIHFAVVRNGNTLEVYENKTLRTTFPLTAVRAYGGNTIVGAGTVFDIRRNSRAISSGAIGVYYDGVLDGGGGFLP